MSGRFIAVVGPSGVGKDTVMAALADRDPQFALVRRVITRPGDAGGEDFDGVTEEAFATRDVAGEFALSWSAHGLRYGIPARVDDDIAAGRTVLANLSRSILATAQGRFARLEVIVLTAEKSALAARLQARNRESADQIARRLARASSPIPEGVRKHIVDNSGPLDQTVDAVLACLYPVRA